MDFLIHNSTSTIHDDIMCSVCDTKRSESLYTYSYSDKQSAIRQCLSCGHFFLYPVPLQELDERTMEPIEDAEFFGHNFLKKLHENTVIKKEIKYVKRFLKSTNPYLLDIGCGTGWTTAIWQRHGFKVVGLEPSKARSKVAREVHHLQVSDEHIENFSCTEKFDIVIMRHLLEHIENPVTILTKVKSFLNPNGLLVIIIPNIDCIGRFVFKENWEWVLPFHLHFYTPKTLTRLLTKVGYTKLKLYQMPSPLWYPNALNKTLFKANPQRRLPHTIALVICLPIVFLGFLLNLNDNMTLIFRHSS